MSLETLYASCDDYTLINERNSLVQALDKSQPTKTRHAAYQHLVIVNNELAKRRRAAGSESTVKHERVEASESTAESERVAAPSWKNERVVAERAP